MKYQYHPYVWLLAASASITLFLGIYALIKQRQAKGAVTFALTMLMTTAWSVIYVCSFSSANLSAKIFWENLMYIPIGFTPVLFLVLCLQFTGYDDWVYSKKIGWLILLPVIFFIIKWTDVRYGLIYYDMHIVQIGTHSIMAKQFGPVFYVDVAYTLLLTFTSIILLIRGLFFQNPVYRRQSVALLAAITLPHIPYIHFLITKDHIISAVISTTILSYGPAGLIMAWGIFRLKLFDLVPVARDTVIETMDAGVMVLDMRARIIDINPAFLRILQPSTDQVIGRKIEEVCSIPGLLTVCLDQTISEAEVLIEHAEHCREYQVLLAPVTDQHGQINGRLVISYDITEKKKARQYQLQQQARMAVIEEQARIARDLHDNLGQLLAFINLQAQGIRQELNNTGVVTAAGQLEKLIAVTQQAHHEVRECIQNTHKLALMEKDFASALAQELMTFESRIGIKTINEIAREYARLEFPLDVKINLINMIKEALNNVVKHAAASSVRISLQADPDYLSLMIEDDGQGFEVQEYKQRGQDRFGLFIMQERAGEIGAQIEIKSHRNDGTRIIIRVPVQAAEVIKRESIVGR